MIPVSCQFWLTPKTGWVSIPNPGLTAAVSEFKVWDFKSTTAVHLSPSAYGATTASPADGKRYHHDGIRRHMQNRRIKADMTQLKGFQKKYLRGLAHAIKPTVMIGQRGLTETVLRSAEEALDTHELIKVKFLEFKEKEQKEEITGKIEDQTGALRVGMIGHTVILYRPHSDPEKRSITLPKR